MQKERILNKKLTRINELKAKLVSRSDESKEEIIEEIKETMDDLELILEDFGYMENNEEIDRADDIEEYSEESYRGANEVGIIGLDELKNYDGKDGRPAYVAVNGNVYDVTNNLYWKGGNHFGAKAGTDATNEFLQCHMGEEAVLNKLTLVGKLKD